MIVAICSAGPGLLRSWNDSLVENKGYKAVWAVNSAAKVVRHDYLSAGDKCWFRGLLGDTPRPRIGIITFADAEKDARAWMGEWASIATWEGNELIQWHKNIGHPINWSLQAAICHAVSLGARQIDIYGADRIKTDALDCAGYRGDHRTAERWEREEKDLAFTFAALSVLGVSINRIDP